MTSCMHIQSSVLFSGMLMVAFDRFPFRVLCTQLSSDVTRRLLVLMPQERNVSSVWKTKTTRKGTNEWMTVFLTEHFCVLSKAPLPQQFSLIYRHRGCYMNIFMPPLEMSPKRFAVATTVLFSALKQAYCALVVCDSELMTVLHTAPFFNFL